MAAEAVGHSGSRKRKRGSNKKKLVVNERVEVRSMEDGFLGSWHPATVISCGKLKRRIRYENILCDDGLNYLVTGVSVSNALDGDSSSSICNKCGLIRPRPPFIDFGVCDLKFGVCVDVDYHDAWWEGVIFDHCDGMEERSVFFPDLGDELKIGIQKMRITQDWEEITGNWERRGNWVFLELVEECERASFIPVSVRQIWYDVQEKKDYVDRIREWTVNEKDLWRVLVMEVVKDYLNLTLNEVISVLNLPSGLLKETQELEAVNVDLNPQVDMANSLAVVDSGSQLSGSGNTNVHCDGTSGNDLCQSENDSICSVCNYGGDLILCDRCPSSFHTLCLGLEGIPDGEWFCPSCRCGICGQNKIDGAEDEAFLTCIQCERKYHDSCLRNRAVDKLRRYLGNWFCGKVCEKIYAGLHKLLGKPVSVGMDNLTWTLVKYYNSESCEPCNSINDLLAESYSKLNVALSVMHECFEPHMDSFSGRDIMEDVIFSRRSELNRLSFQGFYTVLLERNEELISVATVRVYGEKVAEVPVVGTRLQCRRHGMCRILMDELEKKLMQLGVQRLVLPAVPSVLDTWTGSFGFAKMTALERSQFLDHTFLDFQDTIMCQKMLMKIPSPDFVLSIESQHKPHDVFSGSCGNSFHKSSPVSTASQVEEIDKRGKLDVQLGDTCAGNNDHLGSGDIDTVKKVKQPSPEYQQCQNITNPQFSLTKHVDMCNGSYKCYRRRKVRKA